MTPADTDQVLAALAQQFPEARCELLARDPWELLVAAICSARTSDERVNQVMARLAEHVVGVEAYARLHPVQIVPLLTGLPLAQQKARAICESARMVVRRFAAEVPSDSEALRSLPGVGRKVAAVVQGTVFGIPALAVDTHVMRVSQRLGWTSHDDPARIELDLARRLPPQAWIDFGHRTIRLGRMVCRPSRPRCSACPLAAWCPRQGLARSVQG